MSHYENFVVASVFLPHRLKQHFYNVYAYCRVSDDLADEAGRPEVALELLRRWQGSCENATAVKHATPSSSRLVKR